MQLTDSIDQLPRTRSITINKFKQLYINTFQDLLTYIPSRYEDYTLISPISKLQEGEKVTVKGKILDAKTVYTKSRMKIQKVVIQDETGKIEINWFNQPFIVRLFIKGMYASVSGTVRRFVNSFSIEPAEYEILKTIDQETVHTGRIVPIYSEKKQLSTKTIREKMRYALQLLETKSSDMEWLPKEIKEFNNLINEIQAYKQIHFPENKDVVLKAHGRLAFDELFTMQLANAVIKKSWKTEQVGHIFKVSEYQDKLNTFIKSLPFSLTNAQQKVVEDIYSDLERETPMNRFVQGDVGSGKTVVAAIAIYIAHLNGYQTLYMAPTEILAQQHFLTLQKLFKNTKIEIGIQTGAMKSIKNSKQTSVLPKYDILVGTHALLNESLSMDNVGLIIIDEQHKFGVKQRAVLKKKGTNPHLLTMTATPIPRTVALTLYGELEMSVIDEMPKGRLPIKTWVVPQSKRASNYEWIKQQMKEFKTQVFIICPLIDESDVETMKSIKAAKVEYEELQATVFKDFKVGLLHGKLKPAEKTVMMEKFKNKEYDVLVATSVVEVGIDVPNATMMIIEGAERYGLAQLHQLRGRVGRGDKQSYCFLFTSDSTSKRLQYFASTNSGMELAEFDLKLRGSGDMYGLRQHGYTDLKVASFADFDLINKTKTAVGYFMKHYDINKYPDIKQRIANYQAFEIARD